MCRFQRGGCPNLWDCASRGKGKGPGHDAANGIRKTVDANTFPDQIGVGMEAGPPHVVTQEDDFSIALLVRVGKAGTKLRRNAQQGEQACAYLCVCNKTFARGGLEVACAVVVIGDPVEGAAALPPDFHIDIEGFDSGSFVVGNADCRQFAWALVGEGLQQRRSKNRVHGCADTDA